MMRWMMVLLVSGSMGCEPLTDACTLSLQNVSCPECYDGDVTCSLDGVTVTEASCNGCQARNALYDALCVSGSTVTAAQMEADEVCGDPVLDGQQ